VANIARDATEAVAKDRAILRRLLLQCLPADLLATLDIEALIDAMIASTVIEVETTGGSGGSSPVPGGKPTPPGSKPTPPAGKPGSKPSPPGAAGKSVSVEVKQVIPGLKASQVGRLPAGRAHEPQVQPPTAAGLLLGF
jgi:hypothetical protein